MTDAWSIAIDAICGALETDTKGTFLAEPGKVSKLPPDIAAFTARDLENKPAVSKDPPPATPPVNKQAFFTLLEKKAHFFMLPQPIVKFVKGSSMVSISQGIQQGGSADAICREKTVDGKTQSTGVEIQIPGAAASLCRVGQGLGDDFDPDEYKALDLSYHEMTHAWLWLRESEPSAGDIRTLYTNGVAAYANAKDVNQMGFDPRKAFLEAAAYYVEDRVFRWCRAVCDLAWVLEAPRIRSWKLTQPKQTVDQYNEPLYLFGRVEGREIDSPRLSDPGLRELRDAIDRRILAELPLTKQRFMDAPPLVGLRQAALIAAGLSP